MLEWKMCRDCYEWSYNTYCNLMSKLAAARIMSWMHVAPLTPQQWNSIESRVPDSDHVTMHYSTLPRAPFKLWDFQNAELEILQAKQKRRQRGEWWSRPSFSSDVSVTIFIRRVFRGRTLLRKCNRTDRSQSVTSALSRIFIHRWISVPIGLLDATH